MIINIIKNQTLSRLAVLLLVVGCLLALSLPNGLLVAPRASAQEMQRTMTIVPPNAQKTLDPGGKAEGIMKVINDASVPLTFTVSIQDYVVVDNQGTPNFLPPNTLNTKYSAASWIGVYPSTFTVAPRQRQNLNYYIQIPADARPGGHYAAAVFTPANTASLQGSGASVTTKLGTLFYITVNGDIKEYSRVQTFLTNPFYEYGHIVVATQIRNLGDLHVRPLGAITLYDMLGRNIEEQKLSEFNIFPGSTRNYENTVGQKWMIGRYKATLLASYGKSNNLPLMATVYFWVFPWRATTVVVLIIIAVILAIKLWKKRQGHNNTPPSHKVATESTTTEKA